VTCLIVFVIRCALDGVLLRLAVLDILCITSLFSQDTLEPLARLVSDSQVFPFLGSIYSNDEVNHFRREILSFRMLTVVWFYMSQVTSSGISSAFNAG